MNQKSLNQVSMNQFIHLSEHFTLGEVTKSRYAEVYNIPSHVAIENLKRVCSWLEELRKRYNQRQVSPPKLGGVRGGLNERQVSPPSDHPAHPGTPPNLGGEKITAAPPSDHPGDTAAPHSGHLGDTEEPIVINSGYRSPQLNRKVGGSPTSNHLTGCAVDIRVAGIEQAMRYAVILMDYADETRQDYDELLIEKNRYGAIWLHFAVRPSDNRRKTMFLIK